MRHIALDIGSKTIGVALSDLSGFLASPLVTLRFASEDYDDALDQLQALLASQPVQTIVVGFPKNMDGSVGDSARRSLFFKEALEHISPIPVVLWDERLSTISAHKRMLETNMRRDKRKAMIDQMAAVTILQEYLDHLRLKESHHG